METFIEKIIEENENSFTNEEKMIIKKNMQLVKKLYLLGLTNGRDIYK